MGARWPFSGLTPGLYDLAAFDPPWRWRNWSVKHNWRSPEAKYKTMTMPQIAALPARELLAPGGVALIWCTWPLINEQVRMIEDGWGLSIKTGAAWFKTTKGEKLRWGTGFIFRSVMEPFIVATAGKDVGPRGRGIVNFIETHQKMHGLAREHSRKPEVFYEMCERLAPKAVKADVFARCRRQGWDAHGDQIDKFKPAPS